MKKKIIIISSIIIIIISLLLILKAFFGFKEPAYSIVNVERGEVIQNVSVTGTVTPAKQIDLQFENSGKIQSIEVSVGDEVKMNQILAVLDKAELFAQLRASEAALDIAKAKLNQTLTGSRPEDIEVYRISVANAEIDLENEKIDLIDAQEDADKDLKHVYEDVLDILNDAYLQGDDAVHKQLDDLFTDDDSSNPKLSFSTAGFQAKVDSEWQRILAGNELDEFQELISNLDINDESGLDDALTKAKQHLEVIRDLLNRVTDALNESSLTSTTLSTYKTSVNTARTNVNDAISDITTQEQLIATTKINNQISINEAQTSVDTAKAALEKAKAQLVLKEADPLQADIDLSQGEVKQAQANLLQIQEKINKASLRAPVDGIITNIDKENGEMAQVGSTIVSMINSSPFQVETNVSETEIAKVVLGDKTKMTLDALPDEEFSGKVIKIDPAETVVSGVIYYKVTSIFEGRDERIKSGMTVNIDIQTDSRENALYLPYYVIRSRNGGKYVRVLEEKKIREKTVEIGLEGETNVEILSGLQENEQVIFGE